MTGYFNVASALLFCLGLYTLARAVGWTLIQSAIFVVVVVGLPWAATYYVMITPVSALISDLLVGILSLIPFISMVALTKSVANRVQAGGPV